MIKSVVQSGVTFDFATETANKVNAVFITDKKNPRS